MCSVAKLIVMDDTYIDSEPIFGSHQNFKIFHTTFTYDLINVYLASNM